MNPFECLCQEATLRLNDFRQISAPQISQILEAAIVISHEYYCFKIMLTCRMHLKSAEEPKNYANSKVSLLIL